jgi:hypothetical protein
LFILETSRISDPSLKLRNRCEASFFEAKKAHSFGLESCPLLAARTALIRMQRQQECKGIEDLVDKGAVTPFLVRQANEVRL